MDIEISPELRGTPADALLREAVAHAVAHESKWDRAMGDRAGIHHLDPAPWNRLLGPTSPRGPATGVVLHGDRTVSTRNLARQAGHKRVEPCKPEVAHRHTGFLVGGTSPFGTRKALPVFVERTVLALPRIYVNGGRRGYLVSIEPAVLARLLAARPVDCALAA